MPDRLPSLILLMGFWVPAALAGRVAAEYMHRRAGRVHPASVHIGLTIFVLASSAFWFLVNLAAVPPYLPGATEDPTFAPPEAVKALVLLTAGLVLPGTAIACALAFRGRGRSLSRQVA